MGSDQKVGRHGRPGLCGNPPARRPRSGGRPPPLDADPEHPSRPAKSWLGFAKTNPGRKPIWQSTHEVRCRRRGIAQRTWGQPSAGADPSQPSRAVLRSVRCAAMIPTYQLGSHPKRDRWGRAGSSSGPPARRPGSQGRPSPDAGLGHPSRPARPWVRFAIWIRRRKVILEMDLQTALRTASPKPFCG
jgi:hypothetical protein